MGAVGYLKGESPPGVEGEGGGEGGGGGGGGTNAEGLQRVAEDKTAVRERWAMVRKLLLATEAHKKREGQKAKRQQVKAKLRQAQAEELVCSRLLRATLKELEDAPTVYAPTRTRAQTRAPTPTPTRAPTPTPTPAPAPASAPTPALALALALTPTPNQVYVPGHDGGPSTTPVDLEWNLRTDALGEAFLRTRRGKPQAMGGNASAAHVCFYCAAPAIRGKDPYDTPMRGHHRFYECTKRKRDNRREFHSLTRAADTLVDQVSEPPP